MKIAIFVSLFPRLSETFILNQITGLIDRGHEVDIYAYGPGNETEMHADINRYNLLTRTFYYGDFYQKIPANKTLRLVRGMNILLNNFYKKPVPLLNALNMFKFAKEAISLSILFKIIPFFDKGPYDIIHCHFGPNGIIGALLKDTGTFKSRLITTFHAYDITQYIRRNGNIYKYLFKNGDVFCPVSYRWKDELIRLGCNEDKIIVHRMGINTNKFSFSPHVPGKNGKISLLTVARLVEKKGVKYGILAVAKTLNKYPDIEYRIAGDGPLRGELENLIKELKVGDNIKLFGWKKQEEIVQLMKESDILLAPSVTAENGDQEGIPVVLMEAMAMGLPVISTYHSGIPELVQDGITGFLVPERDTNALSEKLIYLIEHKNILPEFSRAGRNRVTQHYDINKLNDELVSLYQSLI
ncbi:MAG: glycosyltransferase [Nitrospirae bacterium]|nr:glycosyltransferase [Nitrospirota bacterium]